MKIQVEKVFLTWGTFAVVEDQEYNMHLVNEDNEKMSLYSVFIYHPQVGVSTVFVLAENEKGACSQARCSLPNHGNAPAEINDRVVINAVRVPLMLRGWAAKTF